MSLPKAMETSIVSTQKKHSGSDEYSSNRFLYLAEVASIHHYVYINRRPRTRDFQVCVDHGEFQQHPIQHAGGYVEVDVGFVCSAIRAICAIRELESLAMMGRFGGGPEAVH